MFSCDLKKKISECQSELTGLTVGQKPCISTHCKLQIDILGNKCI